MSENQNESDSRPPSRQAGKSGWRLKWKKNRRTAANGAKRKEAFLPYGAAILIYVQRKSIYRLFAQDDISNLILLFHRENPSLSPYAFQGMGRLVSLGGI
ncbi:MAG: hypothetical protein ACP5I1_17040 [Candidatus Hinthialibacter sp.]